METKLNPLQQALLEVQAELKAPKSQYNSFGKYNYRNAEDIQEAAKPLLMKKGLLLTLSDHIEQRGDRYYLVCTAKLEMGDLFKTVTGEAREEESKKGMDGSQVTGASSSYARKYALNGLFLIDDTKDSDSTNDGIGEGKVKAKIKENGTANSCSTTTSNKKIEKAAADKPALELGSSSFNEAAKWIAGKQGLIFDLVDKIKKTYLITDEVEKALSDAATKIREAK